MELSLSLVILAEFQSAELKITFSGVTGSVWAEAQLRWAVAVSGCFGESSLSQACNNKAQVCLNHCQFRACLGPGLWSAG